MSVSATTTVTWLRLPMHWVTPPPTSTIPVPVTALCIVRPEGNAPFTQTYGSNGTVTRQLDALGSPLDIQLDTPAPGFTTVTDVDGSTAFDHDLIDTAAIDTQDKAGRSARFSYDAAGRPQTLFDRNSGTRNVLVSEQFNTDFVFGKIFSNLVGIGLLSSSVTAPHRKWLRDPALSRFERSTGNSTRSNQAPQYLMLLIVILN